MIWDGRLVNYEIVDGLVVIEGDLGVGRVEDVLPGDGSARSLEGRSLVVPWVQPTLWPTGVIPYEIDPAIPNPQRIADAVTIWNTKTPVHWIAHTSETTYLRFVRNSSLGACFTNLFMNGGQQMVQVLDSCDTATIAHEMGHVAGLHHEQQRADRDFYVQLQVQWLEKVRLSELNLLPGNSIDVGAYDYGSLMHYGRYFTLKDSRHATIETIPAGMVIGAATTLSDGDIDSINRLYATAPTKTTISTDPPGLQVIVDGATVTAPQSFAWAPGSTHTVDVPGPQLLNGDASTRYSFGRWSDNQPQAHTVTASSAITVFEVAFIQQFKLQTVANGGTVTVTPSSPDGYYVNNSTVTLTATPPSGSRFMVWGPAGDLVNFHGLSDNPVTIAMKTPLTYSASFTTDQLFTVTTNPPDLQVGIDTNLPTVPRAFDWTPGSTHTVSATATIYNQWSTIRKVFTGWSDGGAASHTITVPATLPQTLTATYKTQYMLTTQTSGTGKVTVTPASADGFYDAGTVVTITATPGNNFKFLNWDGDLQGTSATQTLTMNDEMVVTANFEKPFVLDATNILNAASYQYTPLSPGEIVVIFGLQIGPANLTTLQLNAAGNVSNSLAGTRVLFDGTAAPIVYTSANQIAAIVPYAVAGKTTTNVQVELNGQLSNSVAMPVGSSARGIFSADSSGLGPGAILNQDFSLNTPSNPAAKGSVIVLYATGEGQTTPAGVDGKPAVVPIPKPVQSVTVIFGGPGGIFVQSPQVLYAGSAPGETAGVLQVNVLVPANAPSGNVPIGISVGNQKSPDWLTVAIR